VAEDQVTLGEGRSIMAATTTVVPETTESTPPGSVSSLSDCPSPDVPSGQALHNLGGAEGELDDTVLSLRTESGAVLTFHLP